MFSKDKKISWDMFDRETNRLLGLILTEIQKNGRKLDALVAKEIKIGTVSFPSVDTLKVEKERFQTYTSRIDNVTVTAGNRHVILDETFSGILPEMLLLSTVAGGYNDYTIKVTADEKEVYHDTYANFATYSDYETDMTADADATYYFMQIQNTTFDKHVVVEVTAGATDQTFSRIYYKLHKRLLNV